MAEEDEPSVEKKEEEEKKTEVVAVEHKEVRRRTRSLGWMETVLLLAFVLIIGFAIGYIIVRKIERERAAEREKRLRMMMMMRRRRRHHGGGGGPRLPTLPRMPPVVAEPSLEDLQRERLKSRTPANLVRHGLYLDEQGEAILDDGNSYETWRIIRDANRRVVDAFRVEDSDEE